MAEPPGQAYASASNSIDELDKEGDKILRLAEAKIDQFFRSEREKNLEEEGQLRRRHSQEMSELAREQVAHAEELRRKQLEFSTVLAERKEEERRTSEVSQKDLERQKAALQIALEQRKRALQQQEISLQPMSPTESAPFSSSGHQISPRHKVSDANLRPTQGVIQDIMSQIYSSPQEPLPSMMGVKPETSTSKRDGMDKNRFTSSTHDSRTHEH